MSLELRISVRQLVEFLLRNGDLDNRMGVAPEEAMLEGTRIHRRLQKNQPGNYRAEVPLSVTWAYPPREVLPEAGTGACAADGLLCLPSFTETQQKDPGSIVPVDNDDEVRKEEKILASASVLTMVVEGRADGIYTGNLPDVPDSETGTVIDEIKSTYRNVARMEAPEPVHLAQARCYAYMVGVQEHLPFLYVRMTYVNSDTEDIHYFYEKLPMEELTAWFTDLMNAARKWAEFIVNHAAIRTKSAADLAFPFPYREGQKELCGYVYRTIARGKKLYLEAPTGTGKTLATLFPSIKALGTGLAEKIFYLTAKTVTDTVAEDALRVLREKGLLTKSVTLTAKEKVCVLDKPECNPDACPRAKGHFDRVNNAIFDLLTHADNFDRNTIADYAERHQVCPFEMALDLTLFADIIICDYNYVFDPHVYLRRFFGDGTGNNPYIFLVDEAHNLVERGRDMYSADLTPEEFGYLAKEVEPRFPALSDSIRKTERAFGTLEIRTAQEAERDAAPESEKSNALKGTLVWDPEDPGYLGFLDAVSALNAALAEHLEAERRRARRRKRPQGKKARELQEKILNFYFRIMHFALISELLDDHYTIVTDAPEGRFRLKLFCMDPGPNLALCMQRGRATILFSATLLPIQYYKKLLGGTAEDYEAYAHSVFNPEKRALLISGDVTSRYTRRGEEEYRRIAQTIDEVISGRHGNYLVFFPSYRFLENVADLYEEEFRDAETVTVIRQTARMDEAARKEFLAQFETPSDDHSLVGFCVMGGIFSEGIDLRGDSLIGVIVTGTGVPQVCTERELLKRYFDGAGVNGYDYAYRYPGMNKVLQAAGRVIRSEEDIGVVALLDERFLQQSYRILFPREWAGYETVNVDTAARAVERFWNEWL